MNITIATLAFISIISLKLLEINFKNNNNINNLMIEVRNQLKEINKLRNNEGEFKEQVDKSIQTDLSSNSIDGLLSPLESLESLKNWNNLEELNSLGLNIESVSTTELNILPIENNISLSLPNFPQYLLLDESNLIDSMNSFLILT